MKRCAMRGWIDGLGIEVGNEGQTGSKDAGGVDQQEKGAIESEAEQDAEARMQPLVEQQIIRIRTTARAPTLEEVLQQQQQRRR
ncbi:oligopeptide transporter [Pseudozyma hubeiensis SY62]|uniref:Oligopeptide transporter n=1 Tax=Pseudozyma hubeiensis (strain SY62) TaxID=1305764 RepID=R9NYF3_PSEHS|nr:oligopeptide transporter [Pseudozyma hubeiensis SY62]GAC93696.1 oligopeptide transporter [Pseudozyma hubeiensis SY62]